MLVLVAVVVVMLIYYRCRASKVASLRTDTKNDLFGIQIDPLPSEEVDIAKIKLMSTDPMEFPRDKLQLVRSRILGKQ